MVRHDTATCPACDAPLWFGLKSETSGWAVYYDCSVCHFERRVGRVPMREVDDEDAAWDRAESMGESL